MSCKPFKTSEANAKAFLKTKGVIDNFLNIKDLNAFRKENAILKEQAKNKYFPNVQGWNEKIFFENREGTKAIPNKKVFKQIDNINGIYYSPTEQSVKSEKQTLGEIAKASYFKDSNVKKASDVLNDISKTNHPLNKLAKKLLPYVEANNVDISLTNEVSKFITKDGKENISAGSYDRRNNKIKLYTDSYINVEKLILHEVLHSLSAYQLEKNTETNEDFNKLYQYAKENLQYSYPLENIDEFLVALFTNSEFVKELQKLPPVEVKKYKNFLEEVLDHLLSYLGFKRGSNLYDQAFAVATNILEESKEFSEMMNQYEQYNQQRAEEDFIEEEFIEENLYSPAEEQKVKPGVSELFESNPKLANIGTQEQYSQYLDTIFPDSKVKDIVYHGTKGKIFDKFISSETGTFGKGVYFGSYETALQNTDVLDDFTLEPKKGFDKDKIIPALINTQNIFERDLGGNGIRNEYLVEPEQIHILGSKQDIEGFKKFTESKQEVKKETTETKKDTLSLAIENQIDDLIRKGIIKSKCD